MRIIALANQKGGVGKSNAAVNLGRALVRLGKKVLLIDSDPQGHVKVQLGYKNEKVKTISDLIDYVIGETKEEVKLADLIYKYKHDDNLCGIFCDFRLYEMEFKDIKSKDNLFSRIFKDIHKMDFDYVFIDTQPALSLFLTNALAFAEEVYIPIQAEYLAYEGTAQLIWFIDRTKKQINPDLKISGVFITMYQSNTNQSKNIKDEIHSAISKEFVFDSLIRRNVALGQAAEYGVSIFEYDPKSPGAVDYDLLAKEMIRKEK